MTREPGRAPPRHAHGDLTSLAPHERLPEILVVPREKTPTGAAQAPPGSQASSRGEAKDSALLSSRDAGLLEPPERPHFKNNVFKNWFKNNALSRETLAKTLHSQCRGLGFSPWSGNKIPCKMATHPRILA